MKLIELSRYITSVVYIWKDLERKRKRERKVVDIFRRYFVVV